MKKKTIWILAAALAVLLSAVAVAGIFFAKNNIIFNYTDLGVPYGDIYTEEMLNSRLSADMTVFEGRLYVGGGDYDANTGPMYVMSYDLGETKWERSEETLPDEQIKRFRVIGDRLVTLGTDPMDDWSLGNYYVLENGKWETRRVLPSGIHCFDAIEYDGKVFFALGCNSGDFPIALYDGEGYLPVEFTKDGVSIDTSANEAVRVYNLFEYQGRLYAFLSLDQKDDQGEIKGYFMELYAYDGKTFDYVSGVLPSEDMPDIIALDSAVYFVMNRTLLKTSDLLSFFAVSLGKNVRVSDVIEDGDRVYVLGWREITENLFEVMVFEGAGDSFEKRFGFFTRSVAGSFCKDGDSFYISLGQRGQPGSAGDAGRVVAVE